MVLNVRAIAGTMGALVAFIGISLLFPAAVGLYYGEPSWWSFAVTAGGAIAVGGGVWRLAGRGAANALGMREGFAIVALAWFVLALVGAVPFVLGGVLHSFTDAFFETMSGFTTTGATVLGGAATPAIEDVPRGFLFWRSLTHWMGGMGIIVLTLAILPILGVGGMQMFKAEVPGPSADKLTPRVRETAKRLWLVYVGITVVQILLLLPAMSGFDAINHAFATMATGGFSTQNGSVGQYQSAYIDWVITVFMYLAGINFALHYRLLTGANITVLRDTELRVYTGVIVVSSIAIALATWRPMLALIPLDPATADSFAGYETLLDAIRYGAFQAVSIVTTTGFGTADYLIWPPLAVGVIFICFYIGGMAGSTGGGVKVIRHVLMFKNSFKEIRQLIHPQAILTVRLNGKVVPQDVMKNVLSFIVLYLGVVGLGTLLLAGMGLDLVSALGAALSSVGNIGPAFGTLGPADNYAHLPAASKWVCSVLMVAGRLELFTLLILLVPSFWRR